MPDMRLTLIGEQYECVKPLFTGAVETPGIELVVTRSPSPEAMRRQLTRWEFDLCEMAFGAFLIARAQGADVIAIPVFPRRAFFHTGFACHANAKFSGPGDMANKRVGMAEYVQSAALWARGVLQHDYGMDPFAASWFFERAGVDSTGTVLGFRPPEAMSVQQTPHGKALAVMLQAHELDAAMLGGTSSAVSTSAAIVPLFPDRIAEGRRFFASHGFVPANHMYMIRGELARQHPELVINLYRAFCESKARALDALPRDAATGVIFGSEILAKTCAPFEGDAFAYGIEPNRAMLATVLRLCEEQGLIRDRPALEELFAPCTA